MASRGPRENFCLYIVNLVNNDNLIMQLWEQITSTALSINLGGQLAIPGGSPLRLTVKTSLIIS